MNERRIKILVVEDELPYAVLIREFLTDVSHLPYDWTHVQLLKEALAKLRETAFDVVLLDLGLPDSFGLSTYASVKAQAPSLPVIALTGNDDEKLALQAVREGAQDYLVKGQLDGRILARAVRYAIERKRSEEALRQSEEFFRLISENVTDLIAVLDEHGRRLYNSPSYRLLLGDPNHLLGTDSFEEIHPADRERIKQIFQVTLRTGQGQRAEYRMVLRDGSVRHIESQGSFIRDAGGKPCKVVVVSRDITERKEAVETLRQALSDVKHSHEELKATQMQLIQSEKLEAVSTFAAGVAHEVKNPLQTIILGVDYLSNHITADDKNATMVLDDMGGAVHRADAIIRGLMEFSSQTKREVKEEDLSAIVDQALLAVEHELVNNPIRLVKDLAGDLPPLRLDARTMKHVFINLLLYSIRNMAQGGKLAVRTFTRQWTGAPLANGKTPSLFKVGETIVGAEVEDMQYDEGEDKPAEEAAGGLKPSGKTNGLGLTVLKKIIELYGGMIEVINRKTGGNKYSILFRAQPKQAI